MTFALQDPRRSLRTSVKICGVRRLDDALWAVDCGADAIGLICHPPARRYIAPELARSIVDALPPFFCTVGLFVDAPPAHVADVAQRIGVSMVQLHGDETPEQLRVVGLPALKAISVERSTFERELNRWRTAFADGSLPNLKGLVLESSGPGTGGSGQTNDWDYIAEVARGGGFDGLPPIMAAGGLLPGTVAGVIRAIRPRAVDVSSGVERIKGEKAGDLMTEFVAAVRAADRDIPAALGTLY